MPAKTNLSKDHSVHVTDERINTVTAMLGAIFSLLGCALLIVRAGTDANAWKIVGFGIYGLSLFGMFTFSALHHAVSGTTRTERLLRTFDYLSIFTLIAGTVTPLILILYRNEFGWTVLGVMWAIATFGIVLHVVHHDLPRHISNTFFIVLGWVPAVLVFGGAHLPIGGLLLLATGGLVYSVGFIVYVREKPNWRLPIFGFHELWHCFVIVGALLQFLCMYWYVGPY